MVAMQWEKALAAVNRIEVRSTLATHGLSYRYLSEGPALLAQRERMLRQTISLLPEGTELPMSLCCDLFAWAKAIAMAQRRLLWDLPHGWLDVDREST